MNIQTKEKIERGEVCARCKFFLGKCYNLNSEYYIINTPEKCTCEHFKPGAKYESLD